MTIPYNHQTIDQSDIDAVIEVLKGDYLTCGPMIEKFEEAFAEYVGSNMLLLYPRVQQHFTYLY